MNENDHKKSIIKSVRIKPVVMTILKDYHITAQELFDRAVSDYFKEETNKRGKFISFNEKKWNGGDK